jgi:hypothetical protein
MYPTRLLIIVVAAACLAVASGAPAAFAVAPPNDDFGSATTMTGLPFTTTQDVSAATSSGDDPVSEYFEEECTAPGSPTVWFVFRPAVDATVEATTSGSDHWTTLSVWTGERGSLTEVACKGPESDSRAVFAAKAGTTYYLMVGAAYGTRGDSLTFSLSAVEPPPNDDFDDARVIATLPFEDELNTANATYVADDPDGNTPRCNFSDATVWYAITPTTDTYLQASTADSDFKTTLSAWTGERGGLEEIGCSFDVRGEGASVEFAATAGTTYHLMAGSFGNGSGGGLALAVWASDPPPRITGFCATGPFYDPPFGDVSPRNVHLEGINCAVEWEITEGYPDGTFRPANGMQRGQLASFLVRLLEGAGYTLPDATETGFGDIGASPHAPAIGQLAAAGIVRGTSETTYHPAQAVRRDQMATYMVRTLEWALDTTLTAPRSPFTDLAGNPHRDEIDVTYGLSITNGRTADPWRYEPGRATRRDQATSYLWMLTQYLTGVYELQQGPGTPDVDLR